jgi:hypothetical protein
MYEGVRIGVRAGRRSRCKREGKREEQSRNFASCRHSATAFRLLHKVLAIALAAARASPIL